MYWGLALFLTGSGLNVTCINMMLTQRFAPEDAAARSAFLWNYAGMNVGFFIGFAVAGHYQLTENYSQPVPVRDGRQFPRHRAGRLQLEGARRPRTRRCCDATPGSTGARFVVGIAILVGVPRRLVHAAAHRLDRDAAQDARSRRGRRCVYLTLKHRDAREHNNMWAYLILGAGFARVLVAVPDGAERPAAVRRATTSTCTSGASQVAPQWIQNINTVVIVLGGPLLAALFCGCAPGAGRSTSRSSSRCR